MQSKHNGGHFPCFFSSIVFNPIHSNCFDNSGFNSILFSIKFIYFYFDPSSNPISSTSSNFKTTTVYSPSGGRFRGFGGRTRNALAAMEDLNFSNLAAMKI